MSWITNLFRKAPKQTQFAPGMNGFLPLFTQYGTDVYASDVVQQAIKCIVDELKKLNPMHIRQKGNDPVPVKGNIQDILEWRNIIVVLFCIDIIIHSDIPNIVFLEIDVNVVPRLDIVSAQTAEIFRNHGINFSCLYIFQHFLEARPLEIESGETVVHIVIKDAEPVLLAKLAQHQLLRFYTHALTDLFIVFA